MHLGDLYVKILMFYPEFKVIHMDYVLAVIWVGKLRYIHDVKLNGATCFVKSWLASVYTNSPDLGLPSALSGPRMFSCFHIIHDASSAYISCF